MPRLRTYWEVLKSFMKQDWEIEKIGSKCRISRWINLNQHLYMIKNIVT